MEGKPQALAASAGRKALSNHRQKCGNGRLLTTFVVVSVLLAVSAVFTWMFGPETLSESAQKVVSS